jgi:hypothetical protein
MSGLEPDLVRVLKLLRECFGDIEVLGVSLLPPDAGRQGTLEQLEQDQAEEPD